MLPWKKMLIVALFVFFTGFAYLAQEYGSYFLGSIIGAPKTVLQDYTCPNASFAFEVSPVPGLFAYQKGNSEFNRKEILKLNEKNYGLTAWFSYDKAFAEAAKAKLIDQIAYERNPSQYLVNVYSTIKDDKSIHAAADFVTKQLSADNVHLPTVYPYAAGYVVDAVSNNPSYGNFVSVCSDLTDGQKKLRILYSVAHLDSLSVSAGQTITAGQELGKIGSTGHASGVHAHVTIMPDLTWVPGYRQVYNAGYKFYFPTSVPEALVKAIDPVSVILNPDMAYSIVLDDSKRQAIFNNADQYITSLNNTIAFSGANIVLNPLPSPAPNAQKVLSGLRVSTGQDKVRVGESISVTVEALDQSGVLLPGINQNVNVVLSSPTAQGSGIKSLQNGQAIFQVTNSTPGELTIQVSNEGSMSAEKKVSFRDQLKFFEITAPQKTLIGNPVVMAIRPMGVVGAVITDSITATLSSFPQTFASQTVSLTAGRGEFTFPASEEGIFQISVSAEGVEEKVQIVVEKPAPVILPTAPVGMINPNQQPETSNQKPVAPSLITILPGAEYRVYDRQGETLVVFNDQKVGDDYPVGITFTVPKFTDAVSVFSGLTSRAFPDSGELKLTKFQQGQSSVSYFPKLQTEDSYKKIVTFTDGLKAHELIVTFSPRSKYVFTDVIPGITDPELVSAVQALKDSGVSKGNPDGSFGVDDPLNRASAATLLIRAFYSDVKLDQLKFGSTGFKDVSPKAWYAPAIFFASQAQYDGEEKAVFLRGSQGKAFPDGSVKIEEFVTMIIRVLGLEGSLKHSKPWYESAMEKSIELGLITEQDRSLIAKPLTRAMVAKILVKALQVESKLHVTLAPEDQAGQAKKVEETLNAVSQISNAEPPIKNIASVVDPFFHAVELSWDSTSPGPFVLLRSLVGDSLPEVQIGTTNTRSYRDTTAETGKTYRYRIAVSGSSLLSAEVEVKL